MGVFSSECLPATGRPGAYRTALSDYFGDEYSGKHICLDVDQPEGFAARLEPIVLGALHGAVHVNNAPHSLYLIPEQDAPAGFDFYLMMDGELSVECDTGQIRLRPGEMALLPSEDPLWAVSHRMDMICLHVEARLVHSRAHSRPLALNRTISGQAGLTTCLGALLRAAAHREHSLTAEEGLVLQSSVLDTLVHAATLDGDRVPPTLPAQAAKLHQIQCRAMAQLHDPELSPARLARDAATSVRTLHRLFHASGVTFCDWLRDRRLERCWTELTEAPLGRRSVAEVAYRWGFNDLSTFNRSFRLRYGIKPTLARAGGDRSS